MGLFILPITVIQSDSLYRNLNYNNIRVESEYMILTLFIVFIHFNLQFDLHSLLTV